MKIILLSAVFFSVTSLGQNREILIGDYLCSEAATTFHYTFNADLTFSYRITGHFGNLFTKGFYRVDKDTLVLQSNPFNKGKIEQGYEFFVMIDTLFVDGDSCIIAKNKKQDYCKQLTTSSRIHSPRDRSNEKSDSIKSNDSQHVRLQ